MSSRDFNPSHLDVAAFAKAGAQLEGHWPLRQLGRLMASTLATALPAGGAEVSWSARGESRAMRGSETQVWLHIGASTVVPLECQRCLNAVEMALNINRQFLFVHGEDAAAQLDADSDDDVLALTRSLDLHELVEDELLLALPIVPRHDVCPVPLVPLSVDAADEVEDKPNPFAALAALTGKPTN